MIRIWKNGDDLSVPENYFDKYIFANIGTEPIILRVVIGKCIDKLMDIGEYEYGIMIRYTLLRAYVFALSNSK